MGRIRYAIATAAVAIAVALAGCSKGSSDDGGSNTNKEKERMENQQLMNSIRQHIVGTWVHDGDCNKVYSLATPDNEIIMKDELTFEEASEKDTFTFGADWATLLTRNIGGRLEFKGTWSIVSGVINLDGDDLLPPYGIKVLYENGNGLSSERSRFYRVLFSDGFKQMFLYDNSYNRILRYNLE